MLERVLPPLTAAGGKPNRLDLARWLVGPSNPLTPRVTMNRLWQAYFGQGIVVTEKNSVRLILSVSLLQRSVLLEIDSDCVARV